MKLPGKNYDTYSLCKAITEYKSLLKGVEGYLQCEIKYAPLRLVVYWDTFYRPNFFDYVGSFLPIVSGSLNYDTEDENNLAVKVIWM